MTKKILTVDDSRTIRSIIKQVLSGYDCEILEAGSGTEGLSITKEQNPDLIILDIDMPEMNGLEMLTKVRNIEDIMNTPVIMLTSKAKPQNIRIAKELGVMAFLSKPFKRSILIEKISKIVGLA
jgi:CheY-like chemotaxis protein